MTKVAKRICLTIIVVMLLSIILVIAVSCNVPSVSDEYYAYVRGFVYNKDASEVTAVIMLTDNSSIDIETPVKRDSFSDSNGVFYNIQYTTYSFDGSYFYAKTDEIFTSEVRNHDEIYYENLKFKFEYATLYKSTKSDGVVAYIGDRYIHSYDLTNGDMNIHLSRKNPNSPAWYSILIAGSIVVLVLAVAIALIIKRRGNYGKEE